MCVCYMLESDCLEVTTERLTVSFYCQYSRVKQLHTEVTWGGGHARSSATVAVPLQVS